MRIKARSYKQYKWIKPTTPGYRYKVSDTHYGLDVVTDSSLDFNDDDFCITIPFAASHGKDRVGDFLEVSGIETDNHQKNPVAFLDHAQRIEKPIGKCCDKEGNYTVTVDEERGLAIAKIYLARDIPDFPEPEQCYELYKQGILKAGSIGFRPLEIETIAADPENGYFKSSLHIKRCELLEVSLVSLPCNQDAVQKILCDGIKGKPLEASLKSLLAPYAQPTKYWKTYLHINMKKKKAMSAVDQSTGGSFVPPAKQKDEDEVKKNIKEEPAEQEKNDDIGELEPLGKTVLKDFYEDLKSITDNYDKVIGQIEQPKVLKALSKTMEALKGHMNDSQECMKSVYDKGEVEDDEKDGSLNEDDLEPDDEDEAHMTKKKNYKDYPDEEVKDEDDAPHEEQSDLDIMKDISEHLQEASEHPDTPDELRESHKDAACQLEECKGDEGVIEGVKNHLIEASQHPEQSKCMKAAHELYAQKADQLLEGSKEEDMSPEEEQKVLKAIERIANKLHQSEIKILRTGTR